MCLGRGRGIWLGFGGYNEREGKGGRVSPESSKIDELIEAAVTTAGGRVDFRRESTEGEAKQEKRRRMHALAARW